MKTQITNALIIDGTGKPAFRGDILVDGDTIAEVAPLGCLQIADADIATINADGSLVTPGFIDSHSHSDAYLVIEPDAPSKLSQGITTEINGQCGGSVAPRFGEARLSSDWAAVLGPRLTWHSLGEYREELERSRPAINTVQFIGHNTLRSSAMGYAPREASPDDLKSMTRLLEQALDEGGYGFSTGLIYQPGRYSNNAEVTALAKVVARRGGFYSTHMRSEGDALLESVDEVLALVRATGIRAEISHLKTSGRRNWQKIDALLDKLDGAVEAGLLLGSDRYPFCAAGTDLDVVLPDWAQQGAALAEMARLADAPTRRRLIDELNAADRDWSEVMIGGTWSPATRAYSGERVAAIAERLALSPGELVCDILAADGCKTGAFFFGMSEANLDRILSRPWIVPGSDASLRAPWGPLGKDHPHPRAYGTMPEFYRRLLKLGISREDAIARMTSLPAERFALHKRGRLAAGFFADLVVWKEDEFSSTATYTQPHAFATGVKAVMVNGALSYSSGKFTGNRAGRFLER